MRVFFSAVILWVSISTAGGHIGNENNTEIRVYADSMRVVLRTSLPFAWMQLGGNAPAMADEAGQAVAKPLLTAAAPDLLTITAGGKPMSPTLVDCLFEVQNDVAFILNFKRPDEWPVVVRMEFFNRLANLDAGTISVFDYTASRFARDVEPLAQKMVDQDDPSLSFTLGVAPVAAEPETLTPPRRQPTGNKRHIVISFLLVGMAGVAALVFWKSKLR